MSLRPRNTKGMLREVSSAASATSGAFSRLQMALVRKRRPPLMSGQPFGLFSCHVQS
jgi:hypothetical protein